MDNTKNSKIVKVSFSDAEYLADDYNKNWPKEWVDIYYKKYPRFLQIKLSLESDLDFEVNIKKVLLNRESHKMIGKGTLSLESLSEIIYFSCGMKKYYRVDLLDRINRYYPSGGRRYPIEVYIVVRQEVHGLKKGVYHFNVLENTFEYLWQVDEVSKFTPYKKKDGAKVMIVLTSVIGRNAVKYGDLSYKFSYIETGLILQNLTLMATSYEISNSIVNHDDYMLEELLDIDGETEFVTGQIALDFKI